MSDPQDIRDELKKVLKKIVLGQIKKLHESAERTGDNFNVFSFLDMEEKEKTHSDIIAGLLNPQGSHNQGTLFLKLFLEQLKLTIDVSNEHTFKVRTEEAFFDPDMKEEGRLDIVIENDNAYIVIENKIGTRDAEGQLQKYCNHIADKKSKAIKKLFYLTPKEDDQLNYPPSPSKDVDFKQLSYCKDIATWLDSCITKVSGFPRIRDTLHQYRMTVRKLTGQLPSEVEDILNGLEEKDDIIKDVQQKLQRKFWRELKKRLIEEQLADQNSKFQLYISVNNDTEIPDEKLGDYIGCNFLGLTFSIPNSLLKDDEHEVAFRVYYERPHGTTKLSSFNYGFVFCRKRNTEKDTLQRDGIKQQHKDEDAIKRYMRLEHPHEKDKPSHGQDGWLSWDYFYYEPEDFIRETKETLIRKLISEIDLALSKARQ